MRVGFVTTLDTNIGDDFVRDGIQLILTHALRGAQIQVFPVNKHKPLTVYPRWHPIQLAGLASLLPRGAGRAYRSAEAFFSLLRNSRFESCELIVQCGTPVAWSGCSSCEWATPLWQHVIERLSQRGVPVFNLGAGSCYPWEHRLDCELSEGDAKYLEFILGCCALTTCRDSLLRDIFLKLDHSSPLLPCPAFFVAKRFGGNMIERDLIIINYMEGGGHYDMEQKIDGSLWRTTMRELVGRLSTRNRLLFLCHSERERELALALAPSVPRVMPRTPEEYFPLARRAKVAVCNRLHASVAMAGAGIPSISVGTDTRLLMLETLGLPHWYVKDTRSDALLTELDRLMSEQKSENERLLCLRENAWEQYLNLVRSAYESAARTRRRSRDIHKSPRKLEHPCDP